ncbi:kinase-like protein [Butyriboletus roseoflavus]|nr:kinase-like protein [Butyriboletus roseoflavus]
MHVTTYLLTRRDCTGCSSSSTMRTPQTLDVLTQPVPSAPSLSPSIASSSLDVCASLLTTTLDGRTEGFSPLFTSALLLTANFQALVLSIGNPITIGRNPKLCVRSGAGGIIISCQVIVAPVPSACSIHTLQDLSTNGVVINGHKIRKTSSILMHGDTLKIPASQGELPTVIFPLLNPTFSYPAFQCVLNSRHLPATRQHTVSSQHHAFKDLGRYRITSHCLGTGSYASVHLALDTSAHRQVACKIIRRKGGNDLKKEMKEATLLTSLHHPNINRVYAFDYDSQFLYIMLQLSTGGDLFTYITSHPRRRLCEGEAKYITFQMFRGLQYLHDRMISHRDLKPENILLHSPGPYPRIQIADFGLARPRAYEETLHVCGTISYLPPEGVRALENKNLGYVGMPADCWSAGIVIFAMLTGSHPFDYSDPRDMRDDDIISNAQDSKIKDSGDLMGFSQRSYIQDEPTKQRILDGTVYFCESVWASLRNGSPSACDRCIHRCILSLVLTLTHTITTAKNLVIHLLIPDPKKRATVYAALKSFWITSDLTDLERAYRERIRSIAS